MLAFFACFDVGIGFGAIGVDWSGGLMDATENLREIEGFKGKLFINTPHGLCL